MAREEELVFLPLARFLTTYSLYFFCFILSLFWGGLFFVSFDFVSCRLVHLISFCEI